MPERVRIGLVGAGPWAHLFTAPMLAAAPGVTFAGVWARRAEAAAALAATHGSAAFDDITALLDACDAVAFSVPPSVQAQLALVAAKAGKALLLDKPLGSTVDEADELVSVVASADVVSQMILTNRYTAEMRSFLAAAATFDAYGGRASFFGDGCVAGTTFGTPWRVADGGLLDLGPHVLDALDAALGPIRSIEARGDALRLILLTCGHESGHVSQAAISATTNQAGSLTIELHGPSGRLAFDLSGHSVAEMVASLAAAQCTIMDEFVGCVQAGVPHALDVRRGLMLQRLIDTAARQLRAR